MREKIRLADKKEYEIDSIVNFENLLNITFPDHINVDSIIKNMSSFKTVEILTRNNEVCGTYFDYATIYLHRGQILILSNDESIYTEPEINAPDHPNFPSVEDITIDTLKELKISAFSQDCNKAIEDGVDVEINGIIQHFSYTLEDQNNLDTAVDMARLTGLDVPYHANNTSCSLFSPADIDKIYVTAKTNLIHHQTYFNQMKCYIKTLEDKETIKSLVYGDALTGEFLENYNLIMKQSQAIITSLLMEVKKE